MGDNGVNVINKAIITGIKNLNPTTPVRLAMENTGTKIKATEAGFTALKAAINNGSLCIPRNSMAIIKIIMNEGNTDPNAVAINPFIPAILNPKNTAKLTAIGPGADCVTATISINSSSSSQ